MATSKSINIPVQSVQLTPDVWIAHTKLAGINVRGGSRKSELDAVRSLFQVLAGDSGNTDDSLVAVSLALAGTTFSDVAELTDGNETKG